MGSILDGFVSMRKVIPVGKSGCARVEHFTVSQKESDFTRLRAAINVRSGLEVPAGDYVRLMVGSNNKLADQCLGELPEQEDRSGVVMMSDTQTEQRTNFEFLIQARGRVLVAGLGLGVVLIPALKKDLVESIEVIELSPDVIELVEPHLRKYLTKKANKKLTVTEADIFTWKPPKGKKWDTIYFDIWADICGDNLVEITRLKRKFARRLNREKPDAWMGAWQEADLRYERRVERRQGWGY